MEEGPGGQPFTMQTSGRDGDALSLEFWGVRGRVFELRLILGELNDYEAPSVGLSESEARTLLAELESFIASWPE